MNKRKYILSNGAIATFKWREFDRKERPKCRKRIMELSNGGNIKEIESLAYGERMFGITKGLRFQARKMLEENEKAVKA